MTNAHAQAQIHSDDKPLRFNKYAWEEAYMALWSSDGLHRASGLVGVLRTSVGTAEPNSHVPVVWRKAKTLGEAACVTQPTYRVYRDGLEEAGLLFEVSNGLGHRQTLKILKMPEWSELEALYVARDALDVFSEREHSWRKKWVRDALTRAICDREAARSLLEDDEEVEESRESLPAEPPPDRPPPEKPEAARGSVSGEVASLQAVLISMFAAYGRTLDAGCAARLSQAYLKRGADKASLEAFLDAKLMRLFAQGYAVGVVVKILGEDVAEFVPPAPDVPDEPPRLVEGPSDRVVDPFSERVWELERQGMGFEEAVARAKAELGD